MAQLRHSNSSAISACCPRTIPHFSSAHRWQASHLGMSPLPRPDALAPVASIDSRDGSESFCQIRHSKRTSDLQFSGTHHSPSPMSFVAPGNSSGLISPPNNLQHTPNFPAANASHLCQSSDGRTVEKRKKPSGPSRRKSTTAQNLTSCQSSCNANESGSRIASLSRTLSRLGRSIRRRSTASDQLVQPAFPTNFASLLENNPPLLRSLDNHFESQQSPAKLKVILKVSELNSDTSSFMKINEPRKLISLQDPSGPNSHRRIYAFNHICIPGDPVAEINVNSLGGILNAVLGGCDGCVFSFGLTKTGKTYTMLGVDNSVDNLGVIPFAIAWLFSLVRRKQARTGTEISVFMSAVEVFDSGEVLRDLLAVAGDSSSGSNEKLDVRDEPVNGTYLRNLREVNVCSAQDAGIYLDAAIASQTAPDRRKAAQNLHVIFSFRLLQRQMTGQGSSIQGFSSWLRLIDFSTARRDKSGSAITFSGLTSIIQAVLSGRRDLPFRDKKITKIILESLGGASCHVCMIMHISPSRHSFHDLHQVIHMSSQMQEKHTNNKSKAFCLCSSCGLHAPLRNTPRRHPRAIQMGTRPCRRALQRSTIYSDPEGVLPGSLPSYHDHFQSGAMSSAEIGSATESSNAAWRTPERGLQTNTGSKSVESIRCFSDAGYHHSGTNAAHIPSPLSYQQSAMATALSSPLSYQLTAQAATMLSSLSYKNPSQTGDMPSSSAHHMVGPAADISSLHFSRGQSSVGSFAKLHADEVWVDGPPEFLVNQDPEISQKVQPTSQSKGSEAQSAQKQGAFPIAKLSSSPRSRVNRKKNDAVSHSVAIRKNCIELFGSTKRSEKIEPSTLAKQKVDISWRDHDHDAGKNCKAEKEKNNLSTVVSATRVDRFCSAKESSDVLGSVSHYLQTESMKVHAPLVKQSDIFSLDNSNSYNIDMASEHNREKIAKETVHSGLKQTLISNRESMYEVMFEETLKDENLDRSSNLSTNHSFEEDGNFKSNPAVVESKIAEHPPEDVTNSVKQSSPKETDQVFNYAAASITPTTPERCGQRPDNIITSSRKSFPLLGSQAIRTESSFCKSQIASSVVSKDIRSYETRIQSPYSAVTQARPPASASSGFGSESSSAVSFDLQMPARWWNEVEHSSGYETVVQNSDSLVSTSQASSRKKSSASKEVLVQNKCAQYVEDTFRSNMKSASHTRFIPSSSSAEKNMAEVSISPAVLSHQTVTAVKSHTGCAVLAAGETQQQAEPKAPQQKALQILGVSSRQRALETESTQASVLRATNSRTRTRTHPTMNCANACAVDDAQYFHVENLKDTKRGNPSKSRIPKINCFNP